MREELRTELERWGFSDTEVDVYLAMLEIGEGLASDVAERADVSSRHVYRVAGRLEERGFVDVDDHVSPTRVRARSPDAVDSVVEQSRATLVEGIETLFAGSANSPADVELLKRQPTVLSRAHDLLSSAEEWAFVLCHSDAVEHVADELTDAVDRGVLVQFLTDQPPSAVGWELSELGTIVRTCPDLPEFLEFSIVVDRFQGLVSSPTATDGDDQRYSPALYLTDETLTPRILSSLQGNEWRMGEERFSPSSGELPFTTSHFPRAVIQAALHRREGREIEATAEARRADSGVSETVSGTVVAVRQGFVEPYSKTFLFEESLALETGEGTVQVGDRSASVEDYAAERVTLEER